MTKTPPAIQVAIAHQQAGRLREAEQIYRQVLTANPRDAGALHLLGLLACQSGNFPAGIEWISRAIRVDGFQAIFHANLAEAYRGLGRLDEAAACYEQALRINPELAEAHNNLGTIRHLQGRVVEAISCYQQAIAQRPNYADAHNNLGAAWQDQNRMSEAIVSYRRAAEVDPTYAQACYNLGLVYQLQGQLELAREAFQGAIKRRNNYAEAHCSLASVWQKEGRFAEAETGYRRALAIKPDLAVAHSSLGTLYQAQGRLADAIQCYREALQVDPAFAEACYNWATALKAQGHVELAVTKYQQAIALRSDIVDAHYNLGVAQKELERLDEAAAAYQEVLRLKPDHALALNNLGNVYKLQRKRPQAIDCYRKAIVADPQRGEAYNNLGSMLLFNMQLDEAIDCFRQSIHYDPNCAEAYNNLGNALQEEQKFSEAAECYETSLRLDPTSADAHCNRGLLYLKLQQFPVALPEFAWRMRCKGYPARDFPQPMWDGAPFPGRTLLVYAEQGLGDTLHFIRYLDEVRRRGGTVLFEVQPALVPLLRCSGVENLYAGGQPLPPFDLQVPLLELLRICQPTCENLVTGVPYVMPDPARVALWRERLAKFEGLKVGINWQGNPDYAHDHYRSVALEHFEPLARVDGVRLFNLQKKEGLDQLARVAADWPIHEPGPDVDEGTGAFMDTAAIMKDLDLVITSDTSTAHLAGALGVPTWVVLSTVSEWRWFLDSEDCPWYPTMRLKRQTRRGVWSDVFTRAAEELAAMVADKRAR